MKNEYLPEEAKTGQAKGEKQNISADDLKFMRSVVEKTYRQVKPDSHVIIMWGLICMIAYTAAYFFITPQGYITPQVHKWILPVYLSLMAIGICYTFVSLFLINKHEKRAGFIPRLKKQVTWVWIFIALHILAWSILGMLFNNFCGGDPGFLGAMGLSIALSVTGILHSKEWLFGGIVIFAGMLLTYFVRDYGYIILGLATGAGLIIPAIIADRNYRKWEKKMNNPKQPEFDELILSKTRLGIISALISGDKLEFTHLRDTLKLSDGNLSVQISKLEEAGFIKVEKIFIDRKPKTFCKITSKGQKAIRNLISKLESLANLD